MEAVNRAEKTDEIRRQLYGDDANLLNNHKNIDTDLVRSMHEFVFADIFARPRFSVKQRHLLALMALIVLDRDVTKRHLQIALSLGWEKEDIMEVIGTAAVYGGIPVAVRALHMAEEVFDAWDRKNDEGS